MLHFVNSGTASIFIEFKFQETGKRNSKFNKITECQSDIVRPVRIQFVHSLRSKLYDFKLNCSLDSFQANANLNHPNE